MSELNLDWFERGILGIIILMALGALYFLTELVIFLTALLLAVIGLGFIAGFIAEKLIDHILEEEN